MFNSDNLKLKYLNPQTVKVIDCGETHFDEEWYDHWLAGMVNPNYDVIFFLVTESTDVFEQDPLEIDSNTVVMGAEGGEIIHLYAPECPEGCRGQLEDCYYRPDRTHTHINDEA